MHRSRTLLFENPCAHSICSFDRRINHSYMHFCSIRCALLAHYNESGAFFLDLMCDLAHGAAQINPCENFRILQLKKFRYIAWTCFRNEQSSGLTNDFWMQDTVTDAVYYFGQNGPKLIRSVMFHFFPFSFFQ